jgi:hypothetical protein
MALFAASLPGLAWAALGHSINKAAVPVNYFARIGMLREYWWNPHLYLDPWWARTVAFTVYDVFGMFGLLACVWIWVTTRNRAKGSFESILMVLPAAVTIVVFNYHSASHGYYSLIWLPFTMIGAVELALKPLSSDTRRRSHPRMTAAVICMAIFSVAERHIGLVERVLAREPTAVRPLVKFPATAAPIEPRGTLSWSALAGLRNRASLVAYLGNSWSPLLELGMRGWVVEAPSADRGADGKRRHVPESVVRAEEWRQLSADWFRQRLARGMEAVLVERGGPLDTEEVLDWARTAGLRDAPRHPAGYILLFGPAAQ